MRIRMGCQVRFVGAFLVALLQVSCATLSQINLLSTADEIEIGRQAAEDVEKSLPMLADPDIVAYIQELGRVLSEQARRQDVTYSFKVVDTDAVNAFALPGGWLYVNAGLIATADTESELAGVMAHEIGHVVGRHGARQISAQYGLSILLEIVGGGPGGDSLSRKIAEQFAGLGAGLTLLKYGRDMEREADALAVQETYAAGIDPSGIAGFFEKLMKLYESEPEGIDVLFTTHPPTNERVASVEADVRKLPVKKGLRRDSERFQRIKKKVSAYLESKPKKDPKAEKDSVRKKARR